jgi:hypothetical protein
MKVCLKHATLVGAMVLAAAVPAQAEVITARVTRLYPLNTGVVNVSLASGCKVGTSYYFQFTINSDTTRAWYTTLLTAANNKTPVSIAFPGACDPAAHQPVQYIYQNY